MSKATDKAIAFNARPPAGVTFVPFTHKMLRAVRKAGTDYVAADQGEGWGNYMSFDDMERGDAVVLCFKHTMHYQGQPSTTYEEFEPAVCVSAAEKRVFESLKCAGVKWKEGRDKFQVYRIPYRWRPAVLALHETYESREAIEAAMEAATQRKAVQS